MVSNSEKLFIQAQILVQRLERLSADSVWAHRASGLRGSLIRYLADENISDQEVNRMQNLVNIGFEYLNKAAQEIPDDLE